MSLFAGVLSAAHFGEIFWTLLLSAESTHRIRLCMCLANQKYAALLKEPYHGDRYSEVV